MSTTEADDLRELKLLQLANAELAAEVARLRAKTTQQGKANQTLLVELAYATDNEMRLLHELEGLRGQVADNTTPATVLADVEELTSRDGRVSRFREVPPSDPEARIDRLMNIAHGPDPRNRKPLRVPRQGGAA